MLRRGWLSSASRARTLTQHGVQLSNAAAVQLRSLFQPQSKERATSPAPLTGHGDAGHAEVEGNGRALRSSWWLVARITLSVVLLAVLIAKADLSRFAHTLLHINPLLALLGLAVGVVTIVISTVQWQILLRHEDISLPLPLLTGFYFLGITFNQLLPTSIGGDVAKAAYVARYSRRGVGAASATLMARVIGLLASLVVALPVALVAAVVVPQLGWSLALLLLGAAILYAGGLTLLLTSPSLLHRLDGTRLARSRAGRKALELAETLARYRQHSATFMAAMAASIAFLLVSFLNYYCYGLALHVQTPFWFYWLAIPLTSMATMLPISVNGYGVRGASFVLVFGLIGVPAVGALALSTAMEVQMLLFALVGGAFLMVLNHRVPALEAVFARRLSLAGWIPLSLAAHVDHPQQYDRERANTMADNDRSKVSSPAPAPGTWKIVAHLDTATVQHVPPVTRQAADGTDTESRSVSDLQGSVANPPPSTEHQPITLDPPLPGQDQHQPVPERPPQGPWWRVRRPQWSRRRMAAASLVTIGLLAIVVPLLALRGDWGVSPRVTLYTVHTQMLRTYVGGGGLTYPLSTLDVAYPVSGQVLKVEVQVGQPVQAGQPLLELDNAALEAQLEQAYENWQISQNYLSTLIAQNASQAQIAAAQAQADGAKAHYDALNARIHSPTFNNGSVIAPFAGTVTAVNVVSGSQFVAGMTLLSIEDDSSIIVRAQFPIEQREQVQVGAQADIDPAATPDQHFTGTVTAVNRRLSNPGSSTFETWITVQNPSGQLFAQESVYARVASQQPYPTVPELAVLNSQANALVFVYANGKAHVRHVTIIGQDGDRLGIATGLQPGEQVILVGQYQLADNENVIVSRAEP